MWAESAGAELVWAGLCGRMGGAHVPGAHVSSVYVSSVYVSGAHVPSAYVPCAHARAGPQSEESASIR